MTNQATYEETRLREFKAILDNIRRECSDLIDEYYVAFCASGRSWDEWKLVSEYEMELFKALTREKMTFEEKRGGLKLIRAYLRGRIETFKLEAMYKAEVIASHVRKA